MNGWTKEAPHLTARVLGTVLLVSLLSGCHLTYGIKNKPDPEKVTEVTGLVASPVEIKQVEVGADRLTLEDNEPTGPKKFEPDLFTVCSLAVEERVSTYVRRRQIDYGVGLSLTALWTSEDRGFRLSNWAHEKGLFPVTRIVVAKLEGDDALIHYFLAPIYFAGAVPFDLVFLTAAVPIVEGLFTVVLATIDAVPGCLTFPYVLTNSLIDGSDPPPKTELMGPPEIRRSIASERTVVYSFDLPACRGGKTITSSSGALKLPLGPIAEQALTVGHAPLVVALKVDQVTTAVSLSAQDLVTIESSRLTAKGLDRAAVVAAMRGLLSKVPADAAAVRKAIEAAFAQDGLTPATSNDSDEFPFFR